MAKHIIDCCEPWFSLLRNKAKPVEGRKRSPKFRDIVPGDIIVFRSTQNQEEFSATVTRIDEFNTLEEYLTTVTLEKALPGVATIEEGMNIYHQWSTEEEINKFGFLAIWILPN